MGYRDHHKSEGSQASERDTRKSPGKFSKPPPMGAKRKIAGKPPRRK